MNFYTYDMIASMYHHLHSGAPIFLPSKSMKVKRKRFQKRFTTSKRKKVHSR